MKPKFKKEPLTLEKASEIENWSERIFAIALCQIPHLEVYHEPHRVANGKGVTLPDFLVRNTKNPKASDVYLEVTGTRGLNGNRKKKQRQVMRLAQEQWGPGVKYFQFQREVVDRISCQRKIEVRPAVCARLHEADQKRRLR